MEMEQSLVCSFVVYLMSIKDDLIPVIGEVFIREIRVFLDLSSYFVPGFHTKLIVVPVG